MNFGVFTTNHSSFYNDDSWNKDHFYDFAITDLWFFLIVVVIE